MIKKITFYFFEKIPKKSLQSKIYGLGFSLGVEINEFVKLLKIEYFD